MPTTKKELKTLLDDLKKWSGELRENATANPEFQKLGGDQTLPPDAPAFQVMKTMAGDDRLQAFLQLTGTPIAEPQSSGRREIAVSDEETPTGVEFRKFINQLSESVVGGQRKLDDESARYLADTKGQPHVLPSVFRMPKVSAQMKFAVEVSETKGINLLFYRKGKENISRNEQGIDFEIVSVPAPPDAQERAARFVPRMELTLDSLEFRQVVEAIRQFPKETQVNPLKAAADRANNIIVLALAPEEESRRYLVLAASEDSDHAVGMWLMTLPEDPKKNPEISVVYRFNRSNGPEEGLFRDLVLRLAEQQASHLG